MSTFKQEYKGPETGGKATSVKLENWKSDFQRAVDIVIKNRGLNHLERDTLHVSCDITRLVDDLGLGRQKALSERCQAVMSFALTAEIGYYLLSVFLDWTDEAVKDRPEDRPSRHANTHLRDTVLELAKAAGLCYGPQVLKRAGISTQAQVVRVRFFAECHRISPFLQHMRGAAHGLTEVFNLGHDGLAEFAGLEGPWDNFHKFAKKSAEATAGVGLCRHIHDEQKKPKKDKGMCRPISSDELSQMSQHLTLRSALTKKDGCTCMSMKLQGTSSQEHAFHNGTLVLVFAECGGGKVVLCRAVHSGSFITADGNFLHTRCEKMMYLLAKASAAWQIPALKDKVLVPAGCRGKKKLDPEAWKKLSEEEELTVQVQDSDIRNERQIFKVRKGQLALWTSENAVRIARDAFDLRRQEDGNIPGDERWYVRKAMRGAWRRWAKNKLADEHSVASASVMRMDQLHMDCSAPASDSEEESDGPEFPDGSDGSNSLEENSLTRTGGPPSLQDFEAASSSDGGSRSSTRIPRRELGWGPDGPPDPKRFAAVPCCDL